ncbi:hypothetical protein BSPWISOXPB_2855 [uncultured Gammaproteobacteria bacterium]|nr:hypothetical protein BSPWISOXPB_2855 [uncultured Gammaproteobacteria bacterium]
MLTFVLHGYRGSYDKGDLENLENISQVTQQPIADIDIIVPTTKNLIII